VKKFFAAGVLIFVSQAAFSSADSTSATQVDAQVSHPPTFTADLTWASEYIMDGFNIGGSHSVLQPSLNVATPLDGVSAMFWSSLQTERDNDQYDELDFMARYSHDFMMGSRAAFNLHGYYDYWLFPKRNMSFDPENPESMKGSKLNAGASATRLIPIAGSYLVPSYNLYYWIYWAQDNVNLWEGGARHQFLLQYFHEIPKLVSDLQSQYAGISADMNYNDGAFGVSPGWSHSTLSLSTGVYALDCIFSFSVNRQWSYVASVDPNNELWTTFSFTKQF
jgi:hypothetical protein